MSKIRIVIAVSMVCAVAFVSTAVFAQDNSAREKDRTEIEELFSTQRVELSRFVQGLREPGPSLHG